jgi:hypothetical protein
VAEGVNAWGLVRVGDELACSEPSTGRILWLGAEGVSQLIGGLDRPTGMAFQDGLLYVVERRGRLLEVDPFAGVVKRVLTEELVGAEGIACSRSEAFVTLPASDRVVRVGLADGAVSLLSEDLELPTGIAYGGPVVYVVSGETGQVVEMDLARPERRRVLADLRYPGLAGMSAQKFFDPRAKAEREALVLTNLVDGGLVTLSVTLPTHVPSVEAGTLMPPGLSPAGSLRYELESRLFASGLTQAELDPSGQLVHAPLLRSLYASPEPLLGIVDSALDGDGNVYYALSEGGRIVTGWGSSIRVLAEGLDDPGGLAVDNEGLIFVAEPSAGRVSVILGGGETLAVGTELGRPVDLAFLPGQGVAVVDEEQGRLFLLGSQGPRVLRADLKVPVAVTRLPDGDLAVVEAGADRVLRLAPDGTTRQVLFTSAPGELIPPKMSWRVLGGLAPDPVSGLLYICIPARQNWVTVPLAAP